MSQFPEVAVLLPCLNEEVVIAEVVARAKASLPNSTIYVYDNNSDDQTASKARSAGAEVRVEPLRGKGNVVRRMFADIEADYYIMLDGDGTYEIEAAPKMLEILISENLDLVTGKRIDVTSGSATYRPGHRLGNKLFTTALRKIFDSTCEDVLSGYRIMTRRFVKSFPTVSRGFEIEVEMTAHASLLRVPTGEFETKYVERPANSFSKLNTYRDGIRIARSLFRIFRSYSPSRFFGSLSLIMAISSLPLLLQKANETSLRDSANLIVGLIFVLLSALLLSVGIVLNAVSRHRTETLRLAYLSIPIKK